MIQFQRKNIKIFNSTFLNGLLTDRKWENVMKLYYAAITLLKRDQLKILTTNAYQIYPAYSKIFLRKFHKNLAIE